VRRHEASLSRLAGGLRPSASLWQIRRDGKVLQRWIATE